MTATPITVGRATPADLDALAHLFDGYRVVAEGARHRQVAGHLLAAVERYEAHP